MCTSHVSEGGFGTELKHECIQKSVPFAAPESQKQGKAEVGSHLSGLTISALKGEECLNATGVRRFCQLTCFGAMLQILGNKSLKIKYLNPSTVFIATGPPSGMLSEDLDSSSIMLTVQIVDTVTGAPIYRQIHKVNLMWNPDLAPCALSESADQQMEVQLQGDVLQKSQGKQSPASFLV